MTSILEQTREELPAKLADHSANLPTLKGDIGTYDGVTLYEVELSSQSVLLAVGHLPFTVMVSAICDFLTTHDANEEVYLADSLAVSHQIAKDLTYRRVGAEDGDDVSEIQWFGGLVPVTVWVR
jgi:hypothetical protein